MKSVLVNGRFLTQPVTGVQRVAREMCRALALLGAGAGDFEIAVPPAHADLRPPDGCGWTVRSLGRGSGHPWEQTSLRAAAARGQALLNLCNTAPIGVRNQLVMLHDAAVAANPGNYTRAFRAWYQVMIRGYLRSARRIVTVSEFSANEIARHFDVPLARIDVVHPSGEHVRHAAPDASILDRHGLEPDRYVLAVGSMAPTKNFGLVAAAMRVLHVPGFRIAVAGGVRDAVFGPAGGLGGDVAALGYVSDAELRALYEHAACFVFPSRYEGFGLPPLEAMVCGCPVIVSNAASLPEVAGEAAIYCDPDSPRDLADKIERVLGSSSLRDELRRAGAERAARFTWANAAARLDDLISDGLR